MVFDGDFDALAGIHLELVDTVVDDFFQKYIDTVFGVRAIAELADVHAGTCPHMFHIRQVANIIIGVFCNGCALNVGLGKEDFRFFCHELFLTVS